MDLLNFPACKHRKKQVLAPVGVMRWLASEPFRVFFLLGSLWSILGVALWPLFYQGKLSFYPNIAHAHVMIQGFAGAFVIGFLGTAGPRMASAPKLKVHELWLFIVCHSAGVVLHLCNLARAGDALFLLTLIAFTRSLAKRMLRKRVGDLPPQMILSMFGILCAMVGTTLMIFPQWQCTIPLYHLTQLLVYQGFLLLPILGIGSFLFPRILGIRFEESHQEQEKKVRARRCLIAGILIIASFLLESFDFSRAGIILRIITMLGFFLQEIRWTRKPDEAPRGTLAHGVMLSLLSIMVGLLLAGWIHEKRIPLMHLTYISGFGMLMFCVASRVLFGHTGHLQGFSRRSWWVRFLLFLMLLAAATRATADFLPRIMITHYQYAAWTWIITTALWALWHRKRWGTRDPESTP